MGTYSIAIRTLGRAGEKYLKLLNSIKNLNVKPDKVIVVLPHGFNLPQERLGYEEFVFCEKGMIPQRLEALKYINSEYTLFLDDDISFSPEFVEQLLEPLETGLFDCSTGPLFSFFPATVLGSIAGTLMSTVSISLFHRDMYVKILRSGGWSYHRFDTNKKHYYPTESFAWTCFLIKTSAMQNIGMEEESIWLERFGYPYGDDKVMAYKLIKLGYRACIVSNAIYEHNDAKTSTSAKEMSNTTPIFCAGYVHVVFWKRFIQDLETSRMMSMLNWVCFNYCKTAQYVYRFMKLLLTGRREYFSAFHKGIKEGTRYVRSNEYKLLAAIKTRASDTL